MSRPVFYNRLLQGPYLPIDELVLQAGDRLLEPLAKEMWFLVRKKRHLEKPTGAAVQESIHRKVLFFASPLHDRFGTTPQAERHR
jgi:hypothetical protein